MRIEAFSNDLKSHFVPTIADAILTTIAAPVIGFFVPRSFTWLQFGMSWESRVMGSMVIAVGANLLSTGAETLLTDDKYKQDAYKIGMFALTASTTIFFVPQIVTYFNATCSYAQARSLGIASVLQYVIRLFSADEKPAPPPGSDSPPPEDNEPNQPPAISITPPTPAGPQGG